MNKLFFKKNNITIIDKRTVYIDKAVKIGKNVIVHPNNFLQGNTIIEDNVELFAGNYIKDSIIKFGAKITLSHLESCTVGSKTSVGPFARLRPNTIIGENCKIGNFVEIKNSILGNNTKASHLAYVGDSLIGKNCNLGCGVVFVNYNGKEKNKIVVGNNCFIGSNVNLIAPITLADGSYVCAGTTLTVNTNPNDFVIGRCRETIKPQKAKDYLK